MLKVKLDETGIAEQVVSVLPAGIARVCSADRNTIRYIVRADDLKLRSIVFDRASLRRLIEDPLREVKIEYLQRDLRRAAGRRSEFRYPRLAGAVTAVDAPCLPLELPLASSV